MTKPDESHWSLDKRIPLALILAMVIQFGMAMVFITNVKAQGDENAKRIAYLESQHVSERMAGLEAEAKATNSLLIRLDATVSRLLERTVK